MVGLIGVLVNIGLGAEKPCIGELIGAGLSGLIGVLFTVGLGAG
jgi:hypothetical protein